MGASFFKLFIPLPCEDALRRYGKPADTLRRETPEWIGVLPAEDEPAEAAAKRLSRIAGAAKEPCLLFAYSDDDDFTLTLLLGRKTLAMASYMQGAYKIAGFAQVLPGGKEDVKRIRKLSSGSMEEALNLLEETFGLPFYDLPENAPRQVRRGDEAWNIILAREKELKKRPALFELAPVSPEDWPERVAFTHRMISRMREAWGEFWPEFWPNDRLRYLDENALMGNYEFARAEDRERQKRYILRYDDRDGSLIPIPDKFGGRVEAVSEDGLPICMLPGGKQRGYQYVAKIRLDGSMEWYFHPNSDDDAPPMRFCRRLPGGDVVVYSREAVWQISASDGHVAREARFPKDKPLEEMVYWPQLGGYLANMGPRMRTREHTLTLLNEEFEAERVWNTGETAFRVWGPCDRGGIWMTFREPFVRLDFQTGEIQKIRPEVSGFTQDVFSDGILASANESAMRTLSLMSPQDGRVVFRHTFSGIVSGIIEWNGEKYVLETTLGSAMTQISMETLLAKQVWKLVPKQS